MLWCRHGHHGHNLPYRVEEEDKAGRRRGCWVEANSWGSFCSEDLSAAKRSMKRRIIFWIQMRIVFLDILNCFCFGWFSCVFLNLNAQSGTAFEKLSKCSSYVRFVWWHTKKLFILHLDIGCTPGSDWWCHFIWLVLCQVRIIVRELVLRVEREQSNEMVQKGAGGKHVKRRSTDQNCSTHSTNLYRGI